MPIYYKNCSINQNGAWIEKNAELLIKRLPLCPYQGSLVVWDVRSCEPVRVVALGRGDACVFVRQLLLLGDGVACDFGNQLRVVRFPMVADKTE